MDRLTVLGTDIGSFDGWDQVDDQCIIFYSWKPNSEGNKFCRGVLLIAEKYNLTINFITGEVDIPTSENDTQFSINPDWSVFNKIGTEE